MDIQLSPHFKLSEFVRSSTATARGIDNTPTLDVVSNLRQLCIHVLEPLRAFANQSSPLGGDKRGVVISSGYRSQELNKAVGGARESNHLYGYAADIRIPNMETGRTWFRWMMQNLHFDELIWERASSTSSTYWIHVAFRQGKPNRQRVVENMIKR